MAIETHIPMVLTSHIEPLKAWVQRQYGLTAILERAEVQFGYSHLVYAAPDAATAGTLVVRSSAYQSGYNDAMLDVLRLVAPRFPSQ